MATEPEELREIASQFYRELLTEDTLSPTSLESRQRVLSHVRRSVTEDMRLRLLAPFTSNELQDALRALARDSCLGEDGLLPSFFLRHWELLEEGLRLVPRDDGQWSDA